MGLGIEPRAPATLGEDLEAQRLRTALKARLFDEVLPGVRVGRYLLGEPLGQGAMGTVYRAYDAELDRRVAIKVLRGSHDEGLKLGERLRREARALAKLNHPNVLAIYEVGESQQRLFVALELVDGEDLSKWCARYPVGPRARAHRVLELARQAARGLHAAHCVGIVHRDLKPSNMLLGDDGRLRLADFGLARPLDVARVDTDHDPDPDHDPDDPRALRLTAAGDIVGTPAYMAPEQLDGEDDARSDQFGWCATFYEALYGVRPFAGRTLVELRASLLAERVTPPPRDHGVPRWVLPVLRRGLCGDPAARYPDMDALLTDLERRGRRRRRGVLVGGLGAASLGVAGLFLLVRPQPPAPCPEASERVAQVWSEADERAVREALGRGGEVLGRQSWSRVDARLTALAEQWAHASVEACRMQRDPDPERVRQGQQRERCLDGARETFAFATGALSSLEATNTHYAVDLARSLGDLVDCREPSATVLATEDALELARVLAESRILQQAGDWAAMRERLARVLAATSDARHPRLRAEAHLGMAAYHYTRGEHEDEYAHAERAVDAAVMAQDDGLLVRAWLELIGAETPDLLRDFVLRRADALERRGTSSASLAARLAWKHGQTLAVRGEDSAALERFEHALTLLEADDDDEGLRPRIQGDAAESLLLSGAQQDALATGQRAVEGFEQRYGSGHPATAMAQARLAQIALFSDETDRALALATEALEVLTAMEHPSPAHLSFVYQRRASARLQGEDFDAALADLRRSSEVLRGEYPPTHPQVLDPRRIVARTLEEQGRDREAVAEAEEILELAAQHPTPKPEQRAEVQMILALSLAKLGECERARSTLAQADEVLVELFETHSALGFQHAQNVGQTLARCDQLAPARERLRAALEVAEATPGAEWWRARLAFELARADRDAGDEDAARRHATAALEAAAGRSAAEAEIRAFLDG